MIFTVIEFLDLQYAVDCIPESPHKEAAEAALAKVHANTDWSTDPKFDEFKEPKPCQK